LHQYTTATLDALTVSLVLDTLTSLQFKAPISTLTLNGHNRDLRDQ